MDKITALKENLLERTQEWRDMKDEVLYPARREAGNYLRTLQNAGYSVTQLCELWGTKDRKTVYDLLSFASIPKTRAYPIPRLSNQAIPIEKAASPWEAYVVKEGNTITTSAPIPPDAWPAELDPKHRPQLPWTGKATWDDNGVLIESESSDKTNPLQRLKKLGIIA